MSGTYCQNGRAFSGRVLESTIISPSGPKPRVFNKIDKSLQLDLDYLRLLDFQMPGFRRFLVFASVLLQCCPVVSILPVQDLLNFFEQKCLAQTVTMLCLLEITSDQPTCGDFSEANRIIVVILPSFRYATMFGP